MKKHSRPYSVLYFHNRSLIAGAEKSLLGLLRRLNRETFSPFCVLPEDGELAQELRQANVPVFISPFSAFYSPRWDRVLKSFELLSQILSEIHPDLLHGNTPRTNLYAGWLGRRGGIPAVWHERNLIYGRMVDIEKIFSFLPHRIVCNSEAIRARFRGVKDFGKQVVTIYSGVDLSEFYPGLGKGEIRREFGIGERPLLALVARIGLGKGHETFLRAAEKVIPFFPEARFLIVGRSENEDDRKRESSLRELAAQLGLKTQVIFTGYRKDTPEIMAAIDMLVVATEAEPFGRAILEALAAGKPVIGTRSGGTPEVVVDGENGYLVPPKDETAMAEAILKLLRSPSEAKRMGEKGREKVVSDFSFESHVRRIEALYESILTGC